MNIVSSLDSNYFFSNINVEKFILSYGLEEVGRGELFNTLLLVSFLYGNYDGGSWYQIHSSVMKRLFRGDKKSIIYEFLDIDDSYRNMNLRGNSYSKSYRLNHKTYVNISLNLFDKSQHKIFKRDKCYGYFKYKNTKTKTKKELKEVHNLNRKELDNIFKIEYIGLLTRKITFQDENSFNGYDGLKYDYISKVDLDFGRIRNDILELQSNLKEGDEKNERVLYSLSKMYAILEANRSIKYKRGDFGRLFGISNGMLDINPQQVPKKARKIFFKGCYEYDMNTSVAVILLQYLEKLGGHAFYPSIEAYIEDKNFYRNKVIALGFSKKQAKQYFTALFFGADVKNISDYSNLLKTFSKDDLEIILEDDSINMLVRECTELFSVLKESVKAKFLVNDKYIIHNMVGKVMLIESDTEWKNYESKIIPFIYQGIEAFILDKIKTKYDSCLLLFDSFLSKESYDVNEISEYIFQETGYKTIWSKDYYT